MCRFIINNHPPTSYRRETKVAGCQRIADKSINIHEIECFLFVVRERRDLFTKNQSELFSNKTTFPLCFRSKRTVKTQGFSSFVPKNCLHHPNSYILNKSSQSIQITRRPRVAIWKNSSVSTKSTTVVCPTETQKAVPACTLPPRQIAFPF